MKKILILGGTGFVGRILTENLVEKGEAPVLFNRGKRNPGIFEGLKKIRGDRLTGDIKKIYGSSWDVVVDFSCMQPDNLEEISGNLTGKTGRYIFISTASVYPMDDNELWKSPVKEDSRILDCTPEQRKNPDVISAYGEKKAECERILLDKPQIDPVIFRPGLIYGRYDPTDRFYYWLYRAKKSGKILLPDGGNGRFTAAHSEDFADLIMTAIYAESHNTVYNAVTHSPVSLRDYTVQSAALLGRNPEFVNAEIKFLEENNVQPWGDLPVWTGGNELILDNSAVLRDFPVKFRSFTDSLNSSIAYYSKLGWIAPKACLSMERESELIQKLL